MGKEIRLYHLMRLLGVIVIVGLVVMAPIYLGLQFDILGVLSAVSGLFPALFIFWVGCVLAVCAYPWMPRDL